MRLSLTAMIVLGTRAVLGGPGPDFHDCLDLHAFPQVTSWLEVGDARGVLVEGTYAYLTEGDHGFSVVDLGDPAAPAIVATLDLAGFPYELARAGNVVYVAAGDPDLYLIDVSEPTQPVVLTVIDYDGGTYYLAIDDGRLYLVSQHAIRVLDIGNPALPQFLGQMALPLYGYNVDVEGGVAYVGTWGDLDLTILDVHDPTNMHLLTYLDTPSVAHDADAEGNLLYVADRQTGLIVYDITSPATPVRLGSHRVQEDACMRVQAAGDGLVLAGDGYAGVKVIDVSSPHLPKLAGEIRGALWWQTQIAVQGTSVLVPVSDRGLHIADIASLGIQPHTGRFDQDGYEPARMLVVDDRLFVAGWPTVWSLPLTPELAGLPATVLDAAEGGENLCRLGDKLFVAAGYRGVYILDISDAAAPRVLGHHDTSNAAWDVCADGELLFLAMVYNDHGLKILDVGDPAHIRPVAHLTLPGDAFDVELVGDHAFVAAGSLWVVDISDENSPTVEHELFPGSSICSLARDGDHLFASSRGLDGVHSIDVSDPAQPLVCGQVTTPIGSRGQLAIVGSTLYAARDYAGIQVLDITEPSQPRQLGFLDNVYQTFGVRAVAATDELVIMGNRHGILTCSPAPCRDDGRLPIANQVVAADDLASDLALTAGPNPANPRAEISLTLAHDQEVRVAVYDAGGRRVVELFKGSLPSGIHRLAWDGLDQHGQVSSSGVYLVRAEGEQRSCTAKVSLVR